MNYQRRSIILYLSLILMLGVILISAVCVSVAIDIVIENQTKDVLTIFVGDRLVGDVETGEQITCEDVPRDISEYVIVAKNAQGEIVYSKKHYGEDLYDADYKVVIPPLVDE